MDMRTFIDKRLYRLRGFMHPTDAMLFSAILDFQTKQTWDGALAEIGVFYGRSLALMANGAGQSDKVLGLDLFDIEGQHAYVVEKLEEERLNGCVELVSGSSLDLRPHDIVDRVGPVRFFSVDGGHELHHIENDAGLALDTLAEHGVIAFDDFMNSQYPGLSLGIFRFMEEHASEVRPFAITKAKLYVCRAASHQSYISCARDAGLWAGAYREEFTFLDAPVVHVMQSVLNRGLYQQLAGRGLGALSPAMGAKRPFTRQ